MNTRAADAQPGFLWDDRLFEEIWNRNLNAAERHALAMDVLRRRLPPDLFEARVATELARQWRRRARNLALLYAVWTLFWAALTWNAWEARAELPGLTVGCVLVGLLAVATAASMRRYLRGYARLRP